MSYLKRCALYLFLLAPLASAQFLGPRYPPPVDLTSEKSLVAAAWKNLSSIFDNHLNGTKLGQYLTGIENITFSTGLFSIHNPAATSLQYHYTADEIRTAENGTNKVDDNSVYRFASVSKLFTVYAAMVGLKEEQLHIPFTEIFPELAKFQEEHSKETGNETKYSPWDKVTPWGLASHLSGVIGNAPPYAVVDAYLKYTQTLAAAPKLAVNPVTMGLPPYQEPYPWFSPSCPSPDSSCTGDKYINGSAALPPTFEPWTSPSYSNHGLSLLGIAIGRLAGKSFDDVLTDSIFKPLGMDSTYSLDPIDQIDRSVIPGGIPAAFFTDSGVAKASGGMFSTLKDLARLGTSILNSTLLPEERTRRWLKPLTHTASPFFSIGAPWEIHRVRLPSGEYTDLYTKSGDSGPNGGAVVLLPEYGAGFNLIVESMSESRSVRQGLVFDAIVRHVIPSFEEQAALEAKQNLVGTYSSTDPNIKTALTLAMDPSIPGLNITEFINNSTNVFPYQALIFGNVGGLRMLPTIVDRDSSKWAFRIVKVHNATNAALTKNIGPLTSMMESNYDWGVGGQFTYTGDPVNLAVFDIDGGGNAIGLELAAFKIRLHKEKPTVARAILNGLQ